MFTKKPEEPAIAGTPAPTQAVSEPVEQSNIEEKNTASYSFKMPSANRIRNFITKARREHSNVIYYLLFFILSVGLLGALMVINEPSFVYNNFNLFFTELTVNFLNNIGLRFW